MNDKNGGGWKGGEENGELDGGRGSKSGCFGRRQEVKFSIKIDACWKMAFDFLQGYDDDSDELLFLNQASNVAELTKRLQNYIFSSMKSIARINKFNIFFHKNIEFYFFIFL